MKKVLIIANYKGPIGGISGQVEQLQNSLTNEGYVADVFSTYGCVVRRVWKFIELIFAARKYDALHIHGCSGRGMLPIIYGVIAGKMWCKRMVITYHGGDAAEYFKRRGDFARRWLKRADKVIVLNGYLEKVFNEYHIPCIVIPNCITLSDAMEHSPYQWEAPRFISVRHLRDLYNIPCIMRAYAIIKKKVQGATLTILGDGPMRAELEDWTRTNNVEDVTFVGQVKHNEVEGYMAQADIMLSAPHIDNMPVSVMEAMNAGVLVISSKVGGVPYMIEDGVSGMLFEDDDAEGMAKCIMHVLENPRQTETIIANAMENVRKYEWCEIKKKLLPLYE